MDAIIILKIIKGRDLPICDPTGSSDPFCVVKMDKQKKYETKIIYQNLDPIWNEEFNLRYNDISSIIEIGVWDKDWVGKNDYMGKVIIPVSAIKSSKIEKWYTLSDDNGNPVGNSAILVSTRLQAINKKKIDDTGIIGLLIKNLKPIVHNIFVVLFRAIRPLMALLLSIRRIVLDWESPIDAFTYSIAFYIIWWKCWFLNFILVSLMWNMVKRYFLYKYYGKKFESFQELTPKEMLLKYKAVKIELKYGMDPPISKDFDLVFEITKTLGDIAFFVTNLFNFQFPSSWRALAGIPLVILIWNFFPLYLVLSYVIYYGLLVGWIVISIVIPIKFHYPNLYFRIVETLSNKHVVLLTQTSSQIRRFEFKEKFVKQLLMCEGVETKKFKKGDIVEKTNKWINKIYYVEKGQVMHANKGHPAQSFISPQNVLKIQDLESQLNMLTTISSIKPSTVYIFPVINLREHLQKNAILSTKFYQLVAYQTILQWYDLVLAHYTEKKKASIDVSPRESQQIDTQTTSDLSQLQIDSDDQIIRSFTGIYIKPHLRKKYGTLVITSKNVIFMGQQPNIRWSIPHSKILGVLKTENKFNLTWKLKANLSNQYFWVVNMNNMTSIEEVLNDVISVSKRKSTQENRLKFGKLKGMKKVRSSEMIELAKEAITGSHLSGNVLKGKEENDYMSQNDLRREEETMEPTRLSNLELDFIVSQKKFKKIFKKGQMVLQNTDVRNVEVIYVFSGSCQLFLERLETEEEDELIDTITEGNFFGAESFILEKSNPHLFAKAREDCVVYFIPGWYLTQCFRQLPIFATNFHEIVSEKYFENFIALKNQMVMTFSEKISTRNSRSDRFKSSKENNKLEVQN